MTYFFYYWWLKKISLYSLLYDYNVFHTNQLFFKRKYRMLRVNPTVWILFCTDENETRRLGLSIRIIIWRIFYIIYTYIAESLKRLCVRGVNAPHARNSNTLCILYTYTNINCIFVCCIHLDYYSGGSSRV